jgi:signal transduction histidine kinase
VRLTVIPDAGALAALPATIDVSAFRIVQESLTNAARHATGDTVDLSLVLGEDELVIEVGNDCAPTPAAPRPGRATSPGSGLGVTGMAERAELFGGRLDRTLRAGRHVLTVHLPVPVDRPVTPAATATGAAG